jgi:hypothetical protein
LLKIARQRNSHYATQSQLQKEGTKGTEGIERRRDYLGFCFYIRGIFLFFVGSPPPVFVKTGNLGGGHLRRRGGDGGLEVVRLEERLEVEDLELLGLRQAEQLAEGRIGLDDLTGHQLVVTGIAAHAGRDLRAGQRRALGQRQERAEGVRDGRRLREDRLLLGLRLAALNDGRAAAAALRGLLQLAGNLLLELLHVGEHRRERRAERVHRLDEGRELAGNVHLLNGSGRGGLRRGDDRGRHNGGGGRHNGDGNDGRRRGGGGGGLRGLGSTGSLGG